MMVDVIKAETVKLIVCIHGYGQNGSADGNGITGSSIEGEENSGSGSSNLCFNDDNSGSKANCCDDNGEICYSVCTI